MILATVMCLALLAGACSGEDDSVSDDGAATEAGATTGDTTGAEVDGDAEAEVDGDGGVDLGPVPERFVGHDSEVYRDLENWICHPDRSDDGCDIDLTTTVVAADGTSEVRQVEPDPGAPVDCFYVYPTINPGPGPVDEAMAADTFAEEGVVKLQLAHLAEVCRLYAPIYRQITLAAIGGGAEATPEMRAMAYEDVRDSFAHYMANFNDGRPIVLYGHSQGTGHLAQLMADEFDGDEDMTARLVSALLIGGRFSTSGDQPTGGSFQNIPVCADASSTGCAIGLSAVGPDASESVLDAWGTAASPGGPDATGDDLRKVCANPAALAGGAAPLRSIVAAAEGDGAAGPLAADTPFVELEGALVAECVDREGRHVLEVGVDTEAGWSGEGLESLTTNLDFWGLHIVEVNLFLGDLVDLVRTQTEAFTA